MGEPYGLPLHCPKCPEKRYYGILKGENSPKRSVKATKADTCPQCKTPLVSSEVMQRPLDGVAI